MEPAKDKVINFPLTPEQEISRTRWHLKCTNEIIGDEHARIALLETQIQVLEKTPAGGFFTPDIHCVTGKWSCIAWKDSNGIDHRVEDASFTKCAVKHLQSQPTKILGVAAVIAIGLASTSLVGQIYQTAESNGTIDAIENLAKQGIYRVLEGALKVRDNFF